MTTRGILCCNPINIMATPTITWQGEVPTIDPDKRLCSFLTMIDGVRAGGITLISYYKHDGCDTVNKIINRFAPPTVDNNNTAAYIDFMCAQLSINPNDALTMTYLPFLETWFRVQSHFEQGLDFLTADQLTQGLTEAITHG